MLYFIYHLLILLSRYMNPNIVQIVMIEQDILVVLIQMIKNIFFFSARNEFNLFIQ